MDRQTPRLTDTLVRASSLGFLALADSLGLLPLSKQGDDDVLDRGEFTRRLGALAASLQAILLVEERQAIREIVEILDVDWPQLNARQRGRVLRRAAVVLRNIPQGQGRRLLGRAEAAALLMERRARQAARQRVGLAVQARPRPRDVMQAVRLAAPTPDFIEEEYERRSRAFAGSAAVVVTAALARGRDRTAITESVQSRARVFVDRPDYLEGVAGAVLNRSRTASLLRVYQEVGLRQYEVRSARDADVCDKCLWMDGTVIPIDQSVDLLDRVARSRRPSSIARVNPFLREGRDAEGQRIIYVPGTDGARLTLAVVERSGAGQADEFGRFDRAATATRLTRIGIGPPPYHPRCRCVPIVA